MADRGSYEERLAAAARSGGDLPAPDVGVTRLPDEVAEESSVQPANDAIRDRLREQSKPGGDDGQQEQGGGAVTRQPEQPAAEPADNADDEQEAAPRKRAARHSE
jgi:hypothetical protein